MTTLESRIAALEQDIVVICQAINNISAAQTLLASMITAQLSSLITAVRKLREDIDDGDEWKTYP